MTLVVSVPNIPSLRDGEKASPDDIMGAINSERNLHLSWLESELCLEALYSRTDITNAVRDKKRFLQPCLSPTSVAGDFKELKLAIPVELDGRLIKPFLHHAARSCKINSVKRAGIRHLIVSS